MITLVLASFFSAYAKTEDIAGTKHFKIGVLLYDSQDPFIKKVSTKLTVSLGTFATPMIYFADNSQIRQKRQIRELINNNVDLLLINIVEPVEAIDIINITTRANVPVIFFNREPDLQALKKHKMIFVGTNKKQAGIMQGAIIKALWDSGLYDKNKDGKFQYVMLTGNVDNAEAIARTEFSIAEAMNLGVELEQIGHNLVSNWNRAFASDNLELKMHSNKDDIELIISNNDSMALGALDVLKRHQYNSGDPSKFIPIIGVDALDEAVSAIEKGEMSATVKQSATEMANVLAHISHNILNKQEPLFNVTHNIEDDNTSVRIDYKALN